MSNSASKAAQRDSPLISQTDRLNHYRYQLRISEQGTVISIGDGIAWISGLPSAGMDEMIDLEDGSRALIFHLGRERIGAILLEQSDEWAVQRARYMTLETISQVSDDPFISLPAVAS